MKKLLVFTLLVLGGCTLTAAPSLASAFGVFTCGHCCGSGCGSCCCGCFQQYNAFSPVCCNPPFCCPNPCVAGNCGSGYCGGFTGYSETPVAMSGQEVSEFPAYSGSCDHCHHWFGWLHFHPVRGLIHGLHRHHGDPGIPVVEGVDGMTAGVASTDGSIPQEMAVGYNPNWFEMAYINPAVPQTPVYPNVRTAAYYQGGAPQPGYYCPPTAPAYPTMGYGYPAMGYGYGAPSYGNQGYGYPHTAPSMPVGQPGWNMAAPYVNPYTPGWWYGMGSR
jgi:hypothetical protein